MVVAAGGAALLLFPLVVPSPYYVHLLQTILIYAIVLFGLDVVVGCTGQVSLGHSALFGIGAYAVGVGVLKLSAPLWATLPLAVAVAALLGAVVALPALRASGPYFAMVTLAFGTIVQILVNEMSFLTEGPMGIKISKPAVFGHRLDATEFFWLVAVLMAGALMFVSRLLASHWGRAFEALRGSPVACDCMGVSVYRHKVGAFVASAGLAGLAGALHAYSEQYISPNTYNIELAVLLLLALILGGRKSRVGALVGASVIVLLPKLLDDLQWFRAVATLVAFGFTSVMATRWLRGRAGTASLAVPVVGSIVLAALSFRLESMTDWRLSIFGLITLFVVYHLQEGIAGFARQHWGRPAPRRAAADSRHAQTSAMLTPPRARPAGGAELLVVEGLLVRFGGLDAVNRVDLRVVSGNVHGLIGPNGSGKSTLINALTGVNPPTAGTIRFDGRRLDGLAPAAIAAAGLARTFQSVQLFGEMSARDNVMVALHGGFRSSLFDVAFATARCRHEHAQAAARAQSLLAFVGLPDLAEEEARNLSYGNQRLLEIARALALEPTLLLLDEPAAGLTAPDIEALVAIIDRIRAAGITIVLIEHHMDLVMAVCDIITVLDFGQKLAEGTPAQVQADPLVARAYLGTAAPRGLRDEEALRC